jgi:hypothetical protein
MVIMSLCGFILLRHASGDRPDMHLDAVADERVTKPPAAARACTRKRNARETPRAPSAA